MIVRLYIILKSHIITKLYHVILAGWHTYYSQNKKFIGVKKKKKHKKKSLKNANKNGDKNGKKKGNKWTQIQTDVHDPNRHNGDIKEQKDDMVVKASYNRAEIERKISQFRKDLNAYRSYYAQCKNLINASRRANLEKLLFEVEKIDEQISNDFDGDSN